MKNSDIFNDQFINIDNREIVSTLRDEGVFFFKNAVNINFFVIGALGQTRTGTPKRARILSPLCLPISPRGHSFVY